MREKYLTHDVVMSDSRPCRIGMSGGEQKDLKTRLLSFSSVSHSFILASWVSWYFPAAVRGSEYHSDDNL